MSPIFLKNEEAGGKWAKDLAEAAEILAAFAPEEIRPHQTFEKLAFLLLPSGKIYSWEKGWPMPPGKTLEELSKIRALLILHDAKSFLHGVKLFGFAPENFFDTKIAGWVIDPSAKEYSFEALRVKYFGERTEKSDNSAEDIFLQDLKELKIILEEKLNEFGLEKIFYEIEVPLTSVLARMEERGIGFDNQKMAELSKIFSSGIDDINQKIEKLIGRGINLNSTREVGQMLLQDLKIPSRMLSRTGKGAISTESEALERIKNVHPVISLILEWREISKLKSTYTDSLAKLVNPKTGRLHATFNQIGTATGRLSSENPNLQNIPKFGKYAAKIRNAFTASPGFEFVSFDYSQIELRILASLADDEKMIRAFAEGRDIHASTAAQVYKISITDVSPEMRSSAKALNFGLMYGMGPRALAAGTGFSRDEAEVFIETYFHVFRGVAKYIQFLKDIAAEKGYAETALGRKRWLPQIASESPFEKAQAERIAINMPIQGCAADILKLAMIKTDKTIRDNGWKKDVRLLLSIHDELLFEIECGILKMALPVLTEVIENAYRLNNVQLKTEISAGERWGEMRSLVILQDRT